MADFSGCGHYRLAQPLTEHIRQGGTGSFHTDLSPDIYEQADVIIGQRIVGDPPSEAWQKMCATGDKLCVFELDDDLFNIDQSNIAYTSFSAPRLDNLRRNIECAHVVTVTTDQLAEMLRPLNTNIHVVPNCIPRWLTEHERPRPDRFTIGWAGSASHKMDWDEVAPQIARFLNRNPAVDFHGVGGIFRSMTAFPKEQLRTTPWNDSVEDYYRCVDFDIGLAPLKTHIFNQRKSSLKALEYATLGIPVVASAVAPYENFVKHGETGLLVRRDHEWAGFLRDLRENPDMRSEMGENARGLAKEHTIEKNVSSWYPAWGVSHSV